jgi:O-antigen/teichoic acid export membrane protein
VLVASGNQQRIMVATGLALLVNLVLNLLLIPRFGYVGAAAAAAISELAVAGVNAYYVQRYVARTHVIRAIGRPVLSAALVGLVLHLLPGLHLFVALPLAGILYLAGLLALRVFSGSELNQLWAAAREGLARLRGSDEAAARSYDSR